MMNNTANSPNDENILRREGVISRYSPVSHDIESARDFAGISRIARFEFSDNVLAVAAHCMFVVAAP